MDLYLDSLPELLKEAAFTARLTQAPESWPQEITSELFKQLPYLSDYAVRVSLDRVEPQRGFAFGYADLSNKTERPETEHADMGIPHLRIPLIVIDRSLKPLTLVLDGERVMPLTEERVRSILFNAQAFDISNSSPTDPSLTDSLTPPHRTGIGMGGEMKTASAPLLTVIAHTLREEDVAAFKKKLASDATLRAGLERSGIAPVLVEALKTKRASAQERLEAVADEVLPTVVTLQKLPGGAFLVKSANTKAFNPKTAKGKAVPESEAAQAIGPENAQAMQPGQTATAVAEPVEDPMPQEGPESQPVTVFGEYLVQDTLGNQLMGWVFPDTLAWGTFQPTGVALFTNGSAYAAQSSIAGEMVGRGVTLPMEEPRGDGTFYKVDRTGATAMAPVTIQSSAVGPDGAPVYVGTDLFGTPIQVSLVPGLLNPERVSDTEYAIPADWKFLRLNNQTQLVQSAEQAKIASVALAERTGITLYWNGAYQVEGGCGLHKLSSDFTQDLDPVGAEFLLGLLGVDGVTAKKKVAEARRKGSVKLAGLKTLTLLSERLAEAKKEASALAVHIPNLRRDLTKEAAALEDENTVDKVLALNFINPENITHFIEYMPELEEASEKLAEMLLYSYLGMKEVAEGPIERAMKNIEEVVSGLKALQQTEG